MKMNPIDPEWILSELERMKKEGLSYRDMAAKVGIDRHTLQRFRKGAKRGICDCKGSTFQKLSQFFRGPDSKNVLPDSG